MASDRGAPTLTPDRRLPRHRAARRWGLLIGAAVLLLAALAASVAVGSKPIGVDVVWAALTDPGATAEDHQLVRDGRLPRTLLGGLVGGALGVAGAVIQAVTRNPLADPGLLGVNAGAAFAVAITIGVLGITGIHAAIGAAMAGAVLSTLVVYILGARGANGSASVRLVLAGVAVTAVLSGLTTALLLLSPATFDRLRTWNAGSLSNVEQATLPAVIPFVLAGLVLAVCSARTWNAMALGEDVARALGVRVRVTQTLGVVTVTLLCGAATAAVGPIAFVGLAIPHIARWLVGTDQRWILATTAILAPVLVLIADIAGRLLLRPGEIPVGVVTAFVGAPVLIALVRRRTASTL